MLRTVSADERGEARRAGPFLRSHPFEKITMTRRSYRSSAILSCGLAAGLEPDIPEEKSSSLKCQKNEMRRLFSGQRDARQRPCVKWALGTTCAQMKSTIEVNEANFEAEVLKSQQPVVVDFWAQWCGPCKMLGPVLEEIATEQTGRAKVVKVNLDESPGLAERYRIQAIPTLLYFAGGEVKEMTVGAASKRAIVGKLEALVGNPAVNNAVGENSKRG